MTGTQVCGWTSMFSGLQLATTNVIWNPGISNWNLLAAGTNYIYLRAWDIAGSTNTLPDYAFTVRKDTFGPTIINDVNGYNTWLSQDPGQIWNTGFADTLSGLATAYYVINSGPALSGQNITPNIQLFAFAGAGISTTNVNFALPVSTFSLLSEGTSYVTVTAFDNLGNQTTFYDIFYIRKDTEAPSCQVIQSSYTAHNQQDLNSINVQFFDKGGSGLNSIQYRICPSTGNGTAYILDWTNIQAPPVGTTSYVQPWTIPFYPLPNNTTSYVSIQASDLAGNTTLYVDAFRIYKVAIGPEIVDNQIGDNTWRNTLAGVTYNVNFVSNSGLNLDKFGIMVTTTTDGSGVNYTTWSVIASNIGAQNYLSSWQIQPDSYFFNTWPQGKNYVHVQVSDLVPSSTTLYNAFYILKDTAPPFITNLQQNATFYASLAGISYNVNFADAGIGISTAQYMVSYSSTDPLDTQLMPWTTIFSSAPQPSFTNSWQVNFASLAQWATNYVSVRCFDGLGYETTSFAVFTILKDTTPPNAFSLLSPLTAPPLITRWYLSHGIQLLTTAHPELMITGCRFPHLPHLCRLYLTPTQQAHP